MLQVVLSILKQYGFGAAVMTFVAFLLYYVLKWAAKNQETILDQSVKREESQRHIINKQSDALNLHIKELKSQRRQTTKYHKQEIRDHESISQGLKEIEQALGRINGYKTTRRK